MLLLPDQNSISIPQTSGRARSGQRTRRVIALHHARGIPPPAVSVSSIPLADYPLIKTLLVVNKEMIAWIISQAVMKEALRIHPGIGFPLERYVPEGGVTVCGIHIPAGTNISMSAPTVHFDPAIYGPDVDHFRPERWIDSPLDQIREMDRCFLAVRTSAFASLPPSLHDFRC